MAEPTEAEVAQANKLKEEGNDLMKVEFVESCLVSKTYYTSIDDRARFQASQFDAAIQKYNEAIKLNRDPVYFCNRHVLSLTIDVFNFLPFGCF